ncbi:MAG: YddF family protein [Burkholderiales bacterium]
MLSVQSSPVRPVSNERNIVLFNSPVLTSFGTFSFVPITIDEARQLIAGSTWTSAIGHDSTANIVGRLLGIDCPFNRVRHQQQIGESAIVFRLAARAPEGQILDLNAIERIGYSFGLLTRRT